MTFSRKANPNASDSELEAKIVIDHNKPELPPILNTKEYNSLVQKYKQDKKDLPYLYNEILKFEEWNRKNYL